MKNPASLFAVDTGAGVHLYRIVQEALNNVSRHAAVTEAWVRLKFLPGSLELEVEDHGKGFVSGPESQPPASLAASASSPCANAPS